MVWVKEQKLPINNTVDCSYDTNIDKAFSVTDYEECEFTIASPSTSDQVIYLWSSAKWTYNNLTPFIVAIIAAGGTFLIYHKKTKNTS